MTTQELDMLKQDGVDIGSILGVIVNVLLVVGSFFVMILAGYDIIILWINISSPKFHATTELKLIAFETCFSG